MRKVFSFSMIVVLLSSLLVAIGCDDNKDKFIIATTTSLYDTGLWDELVPLFEDKYDVDMEVLYAGTGVAIGYGQSGDVDAIAVHSKSQELQFVADGYGVLRVPFAYNYFLIVGPASDPAGIKDMTPENAFKKLKADASSKFISRGDGSGTHSKEKAIWKAAGFDYDTEIAIDGNSSWYVEGGAGMGPTLTNASELGAYTLSDIGTFLSYQSNLDLVRIVESGSSLLNVYSVLACTEAKDPDMAQNLVNFMVSAEIQELIGNFGVADYGSALFTPCAGNEPSS